MPLTAHMVARVTMNGCILSHPTAAPLINPTVAPPRIPDIFNDHGRIAGDPGTNAGRRKARRRAYAAMFGSGVFDAPVRPGSPNLL